MNNLENINRLKKSRNVWLLVAVVAALGAAMRWFGAYGEGPGTISWLTIVMFVIALLIVVSRHIKLNNIS